MSRADEGFGHMRQARQLGELAKRMIRRQPVFEIGDQLHQLLGKIVGRRLTPVALQRIGGFRIAARRAAEAEIDAIRKESGEHRKSLGDFQRRIMRQHDAAAADLDPRRDVAAIGPISASGLAQASIGVA